MTNQFCNTQRELELYFENEEWLVKPATIALSKAHKAGKFDYERALKFLTNKYRDAAKQYCLEHGSMTDNWRTMFPVSDRKACALVTLEGMLQEFRLGNYWD